MKRERVGIRDGVALGDLYGEHGFSIMGFVHGSTLCARMPSRNSSRLMGVIGTSVGALLGASLGAELELGAGLVLGALLGAVLGAVDSMRVGAVLGLDVSSAGFNIRARISRPKMS